MKDIHILTKALQGTGSTGMPIEDVILVCAGRSEGRRLLQQCAATGALLIGVTAESPLSLAMDVCAAQLSSQNAPRLISDNEATELILDLLAEVSSGYYSNPVAKTAAVAKELLKNFHELDMACIDSLSGTQKLDDTQTLRQRYDGKKKDKNVLDIVDLLKYACQIAAPDDRRYVALSSYAPSPLEKKLLDKLSGNRLTIVPISAPQGIEPPANVLGKNVPAIDIPTDLNGRSRFISCRGMDTEVRFVFRDILADSSISAGDCAIIYLSGEYAQQIYETAARFHIPVDMSAGIPMNGSGIFAMLSQLLTLPEENYNVEKLCSLLDTGICTPHKYYHLASALRNNRVGWGKDRYERFLGELKDQPDETLSEYAEKWAKFFDELFYILEPSGSLPDQQRALQDFLLHYTNRMRHGEAAAYACATKLICEISSLRPGETVLQRLVELMRNCNYLNSPAQPGQLFCVPLSQALCTGRKRLYILGLSRYALQNSNRESPILDDAARKHLNLKNAHSTENENTFRLLQAVVQHEGDFVFCYPNFDSERMLDQQPSPVYHDLKKAANATDTVITYIPDKATPLTSGDHMLHGSAAGTYNITQWNPSITVQTQEAKSHRQQIETFPFSCSSLETAFQCPLKFYLEKILHFSEPDIPKYSDNAWLPKNEMGTFCHRVLEKYYQTVIDQQTPDLDELMQQECRYMESRNPVPSKELQEKDLEKAKVMIENAINWTSEEDRTVRAVEYSFGKNAGNAPIPLTINGKTLLLSGQIDRVDEINGKFNILDYKTGDADRFEADIKYHLQHYLYTLAEERSNHTIENAEYLFLGSPSGAKLVSIEENTVRRTQMAKTVENLLDWLSDEEKCMMWAPCLTEKEGIMDQGDIKNREKAQKICSYYCIYKEFCQNA